MNHEAEWDLLRQTLETEVEAARSLTKEGKTASYIPELAGAPQHALGITLLNAEGGELTAGDCGLRFTLQSISKVFTLILALMDRAFRSTRLSTQEQSSSHH